MENSIKIKEMFTKDITRDINGVIKVDQKDENHVYTELDEYVITQETRKYFDVFFERFIESIDSPTDKIGVWVSGFFGSGKSHFIKMISYLLENKEIKGKKPLEFFKEKINDPQITSNIEKAVGKGTKDVILFNIDSKANSAGAGAEQIVNVFMKVFNEKRGYLGDVFWIAELEEDLDYKGLYDKFKEEFKKISGNTWESKREAYAFEQDAIIEALNKIDYQSKESLERLFESDGSSYSLSVEKFANKVKKYCDKKGKDHQVLFLVDEVGQYIGESSDLMLNLQTVVEDLGTRLQGKSWVIVTSQADIDTITKEQVKGGDFSKIQGRFGKPLNLSSANVDEVIKKRLLEKTPEIKKSLESYYGEKETILKNLISFTQGTAEMKSYSSAEGFSEVYPFVPYQFNLLQKVFDQIRITGFTGKHLAKGERSMLSAFKESTENLVENSMGILVPFSDFYNSIESFLDPIIKRTIDHAKANARLNEQDIKLLETLFLIKHIKEIKSNVDNLTVLSINNIDEDKLQLKKSIIESLDKLKAETLIHQSDDCYYFLTNEEQEINKEIKNQDVDRHSVRDDIFNIVYDDICPPKYGIYQFNKILDDRTKPIQKADLTIKFVTPQYVEPIYSDQQNIGGSKQCIIDSTDTLLIIFPENSEFVEQIKENRKISSYLAHKYSNSQPDVIKKILDEKTGERDKLKSLAKENIRSRLVEAEVYIDNTKVDLDFKDPADFIKEGLKILVENVYRKAGHITQEYETEDDLRRILQNNDMEKWGIGNTTNANAIKEVLDYIKANHEQNVKLLLGEIKSKYTKKPYGWKEMTIAGILTILYIKEDITIKYQQEVVSYDVDKVTKYLSKRDYSDKIRIGLREKAGEQEINEVKKLLRELFEKTDIPSTETDLYNYTKKEIDELQAFCSSTLNEYSINSYPGKEAVDKLEKYLGGYKFLTEPSLLLKHLAETKDEFKELLEEVNPVKNFFKSTQIKIFSEGREKLERFERNKVYLTVKGKTNFDDLKKIIDLQSPYKEIKNIPLLTKGIETELSSVAKDKKTNLISAVDNSVKLVQEELNKHTKLSEDFKTAIFTRLNDLKGVLEKSEDCTLIVSQKTRIDETKGTLFEEISHEVQRIAEEEGKKDTRTTKSISGGEFFGYPKTIENEEDIKKYLKELEEKLKDLIKKQNLRVY
ncbi:BREX system P-loop protein BrxC [Candidatus Woesearchaeota archaeon]|nr:BREX system P-loop protein BrxC [Candidatus Woesearchaeota archaeon]